jgi:putative endopeptidase
MDLAGLRALAPNFDWAQLMQEMALPESIPINVTEPELLKKFNAQLTAVPVSEWRVWLHWRALKVAAPYLPQAIAGESFHFEKTVLAGTEQSPPRWETCAELVDQDLSDALGQAYVEKYFPPEAKRRMSQLVKKFDVRTACVVNQFNALDVGEGLHHNGKQVLGEALGDLGAQQCKLW